MYAQRTELPPRQLEELRGSRTTAALPTGTSTVKSNTVAKSLGKKLYFGRYVVILCCIIFWKLSILILLGVSATDNPELTDAAYVATLSDNTLFGQLTPGNSMKWVRVLFYRAALAKHDFTRTQLNHPEVSYVSCLETVPGRPIYRHLHFHQRAPFAAP
jgi:hypothetical protein